MESTTPGEKYHESKALFSYRNRGDRARLGHREAQQETDAPMTFFVTGESHSGDLGGLAGADATCQRLATEVGAGDSTWRAYLSAYRTVTEPAVNARDRIGNGPWHNARGVMIAPSVADLHGDIQRDRDLIYRATTRITRFC